MDIELAIRKAKIVGLNTTISVLTHAKKLLPLVEAEKKRVENENTIKIDENWDDKGCI